MQDSTHLILAIVLSAVIAYLIGSISFSIIFTKLFDHNKDIRTMGSGNAGMTNVLRSAGMKPGVLTTICDFGKGILSCFIGAAVFTAVLGGDGLAVLGWGVEPYRYGVFIAGIACVLGHMFPIFFGFRGGKGVLTTAAVLLMIYPPILAVDFSLFLVLALLTGYVSLGSVMAAATFPLWGWLFHYFVFYRAGAVSFSFMVISTLLLAFLGACVVLRHHANIRRLIHHEEKKFHLHHDS